MYYTMSKILIFVAILIMAISPTYAQTSKHSVTPPSLEPPQENLYPTNKSYPATIKSVEQLTDDVCHVVIDHGGNIPAWEGMVYLAVPPAIVIEKYAYFTLATTRYGDYFDGKTASLCVHQVENGKVSNYLCDAKNVGHGIGLAGPTMTNLLLAENNRLADQIMVATKTGIAPFRGYLRRMFLEKNVRFHFKGLAWLFFGVDDEQSLLYGDELKNFATNHPGNFKFETAFKNEGKEVHHIIEESISEIYDKLNGGAYISFCGLKEMMPPIYEVFRKEARRRGDDWQTKYFYLTKGTKQWREIVYEYGNSKAHLLPHYGYGKSENAIFAI